MQTLALILVLMTADPVTSPPDISGEWQGELLFSEAADPQTGKMGPRQLPIVATLTVNGDAITGNFRATKQGNQSTGTITGKLKRKKNAYLLDVTLTLTGGSTDPNVSCRKGRARLSGPASATEIAAKAPYGLEFVDCAKVPRFGLLLQRDRKATALPRR